MVVSLGSSRNNHTVEERCVTTLKTAAKVVIVKFVKYLRGAKIRHTSLRPPPSSHVEFSLALGCLVRTTIREENQRLLSAWLLEVEVFMSRHKV